MFSRTSSINSHADDEQEPAPKWFTSLEDFHPLQYRYHQGKYMESWFACALVTGEHFILKKCLKGEE